MPYLPLEKQNNQVGFLYMTYFQSKKTRCTK
jgi:hypothetical protein